MKNVLYVVVRLLFIVFIISNVNADSNKVLQGFVKISLSASEYYIGQYPITNAEYKEFLNANSSVKAPVYWKNNTYPTGKANHPVVFVSYDDANKYCKWLESKNNNYTFRLPTIEEWEYAARGNNNYDYPWGNNININNFNFNAVIAKIALEQNPLVTYNNPKSAQYGKSYKLNQIISLNSNGRVQGWINHRDYTGFVYTDYFKNLMDNGGYTTPVNQYPNGKSPFGVL